MLHKDLTGGDLHVTKLHAATHLAGGTDPLGLAESEITDLVADLSSKVETGDGRLSDPRVASDVSAWAKAATKPTYASSEITNISAAGQALIDDANAAAQLVTLGTAAYSEGTWTPVLTGFTIVGAAPACSGIWKRIGNVVFASCKINSGAGGNTSIASSGPYTSYISGLPTVPSTPYIAVVIDGNGRNLGTCMLDTSANLYVPSFTALGVYLVVSTTYFV